MKRTTKFTTSTLVASVVVFAALIAAVIVDGKENARAADAMAKAAQAFLAALTPEQKAKATFSFNDDQRFDWHFVPQDRKGLPLKEMNDAQRKAAMNLLNAALSPSGYKKATSIISLEPVLAELEGPNRRFPRDPELYYVTIFGEPGKGDWGFRFEGHHISQNFTVTKGRMVADAPAFFGTNPAQVLSGPQKGLRVLGAEEDLARALVTALDEKQRQQAIYDPKAPSDILSFDKRTAQPLDKVGIKASALNAKQYAMLEKLIEEYLNNVPADVAALRRAKLKATKKDELLFAWAGPIEKAKGGYTLEAHNQTTPVPTGQTLGFQGHYYRVQSPSFLIEYDNTQNNANHVHSVWRDFSGDWGRDLLAEHYQTTKHPNTLVRR
ncbi:MAG TPA: DUF3500 domain-containing protein [Blastocatellia bacterium]|nr:DUF3500 domain-containing protein [Blastocatellia bacterium]